MGSDKLEINMDNQNKEQNSTEETTLEKEKNSTEKDNNKVEVLSNTDNVDTDLVAEYKESSFDEHCQDCKRNYKVGESYLYRVK